ncbi:MAG: tRNA 2-selenouridine(34) synthase MnmH [Chitinophagales bacterium]|nr:tRNA 2-selenouridine(34) synthase MnmH [Chitinophagales bacterium]MDW8428684.1 tRNA 2-selenouridine(34) synthase MnmH [Chitinophagales bacterium]
MEQLDARSFVEASMRLPVVDVRSPGEYIEGHLPGALNVPLLNDEQRRIIGTLYRNEGREAAMFRALDFYGPSMQQILQHLQRHAPKKQLLVYCWRGGLRSRVVAWMLELFGYRVATLAGGYKALRNLFLETMSQPFQLWLIGGYTGSGKTEALNHLKQHGFPVIDLEQLACHRGSVFGGFGQPSQPTQQQFENTLSLQLLKTASKQPIWLEDESQRIGNVNVPRPLWLQMRQARVYFLDIPFEKRLDYLMEHYAYLSTDQLITGTQRISRRLGGQRTQQILNLIQHGNRRAAFALLLQYYDKLYDLSLSSRASNCVIRLRLAKPAAREIVEALLQATEKSTDFRTTQTVV